jgi:hypothetical protein
VHPGLADARPSDGVMAVQDGTCPHCNGPIALAFEVSATVVGQFRTRRSDG